MRRRRTLIASLFASLAALPAEAAEPECQVARFVWELDLVQVIADVPAPGLNLNAVAAQLGTKARLGGGIRDPGQSGQPVRADLLGSTDGARLVVGLELQP
ncbi:MAG: hypothetical protein ABW252_07415 [Polyangiales bacterium]